MANSDKNISIIPNRSLTGQPQIIFTGQGNDPITLKVLDSTIGSLSFEGSAGQLLSITDSLSSGSIFSVNDISGMPSIDVNADGTVALAPFSGNIAIGVTSASFKLHVNGTLYTASAATFNSNVILSNGNLQTTTSTFNLITNTASTINIGTTSGSTISIASTTGTTTVNNSAIITGNLTVNGGTITSTATTFNLLNTTVTNANVLGAADTILIGSAGGSTTIRNAATRVNGTLTVTGVSVHQGAGAFNSTLSVTGTSTLIGDVTASGDIAVNGGDITSTSTTFNLLNATVTGLNVGGAANTVLLGGTGGTTTIRNAGTNINGTLTVTGVSVHQGAGAFNSTLTVTGATVVQGALSANGALSVTGTSTLIGDVTASGDLAVNGGDITSTATTFNLLNTTVTGLNVGGAANTVVLGGTGGTSTIRNAGTNINGTLTVTGVSVHQGAGTFNSTLSVTGVTTLQGASTLQGAVNMNSTLTVTGVSVHQGAGAFNSTLTVTGVTTLQGASTLQSAVNMNSTLTVTGVSVHQGAGAFNSTLSVTGASTLIGDVTASGDIAVNGGDITSTATTFNLLNATVTNANVLGAANTVLLGGTGGTATIRNAGTNINGTLTVTGVSVHQGAGAFNSTLTVTGVTTLQGASTLQGAVNMNSTLTVTGVSVHQGAGAFNSTLSVTGAATFVDDIAVNGGDITSTATTFNLLNTTVTNANVLGVANTVNIGSSVATINLGTGTTGANIYVKGNLYVQGATTTISSTTVSIADLNIVLADGQATTAGVNGAGISLGSTGITWQYNNTGNNWESTENVSIATGKAYKINNSAVLSSTVLGSSVTSASGLVQVGTIGLGTWQAGTIVTTYGGTGLSSYTAGDILYYVSGTTLSKLAISGTTNYVMTSDGSIPVWTVNSGTGSVVRAISSTLTGATLVNPIFTTVTATDLTLSGDIAVNGGDITSTATTFNLLNTTVTNANVLGAANTVVIGGTGGATTIRNAGTNINGTLTVTGVSVHQGAGTFNSTLSVTGVTTLQGASTLQGAVNMNSTLTVTGVSVHQGAGTFNSTLSVTGVTTLQGASTLQGAVNMNSTLTVTGVSVHQGAGAFNSTLSVTGASTLIGDVTASGDIAVNGGDITSTATTFNLLNTTVTNANVLGAATRVVIGANSSGAALIRNSNILLGGTVTGTTTISTTTGTAAHLTISPQGNLTLSPLGSVGAGGIRPSVTVPNNSAGTGTISISGAYVLIGNRNDGSDYSGEIRIQEQSGNDYFGLKAPDTMAASTTYTLPSAFPASAGYVLQSTTTGLMTWAAPAPSANVVVTATSASSNYKLVFTDVNATNTSASLLIDTTSGIVYNPSTDALIVNGPLSANSTLSVTGDATFAGSVIANGGTITSSATTFNLLNTTVTNANVLGAANTILIGSISGTTTIRNAGTNINGNLTVSGSSSFGAAVDHTFGLSNRGVLINAGKGTSEILSYGNETLAVSGMGGNGSLELFGGNVTVGDDGNNDGTQIVLADNSNQTITYYASGGHIFGGVGSFDGLLTASAGISVSGATAAIFNGTVSCNSNTIYKPTLQYYNEVLASPAISANVLTLDLSTAQMFTVSLNANITTFTITNTPATANRSIGFTLIFTADGTARTVTWGAAVKWANNDPPALTSTNAKKDILSFVSPDGGTTFYGFIGGLNF